jgi:hypothetical protein
VRRPFLPYIVGLHGWLWIYEKDEMRSTLEKKKYCLKIAAVEVLLFYLSCLSAQRDISMSLDGADLILFHKNVRNSPNYMSPFQNPTHMIPLSHILKLPCHMA